ncbi:hypothetical protein NXX20_10750 [Bacteroides stercoris]|nr:hypothetical protein [Bacteroides stercoris]
MEQIRPLEYTIKIYGEGFTEWFYFDGLRTNNRLLLHGAECTQE